MWLAISAFVLALVAVGNGVAVSITSWLRTRALERWKSQMESELRKQFESIAASQNRVSDAMRAVEAATPAKLAAEVAELSEAVAKLGDTHRKFAGRVWATIQHSGSKREADNGVDDDELAAVIALQTASPPKPN